ncbi:hypothetical protein PVBG_03313 [Plasmodium vivax Brazil I]|uniref:Uncharacterized protein n=1 Tax=Plasmodium vivax (strain Brazil I) TaxID=1033975 RepID=A0A0J9T4M5_PLAV1|nr:hypothetical protein PVBG_03313 [Plasmodium vivax Brazil I]
MLPSDNFYRTLDHNNEHLGKYYAECKEFSSNKKYIGLRRYCAVVLNYLENIYKKSEKQNWAYDDCLLLNYWIFGKIYEQQNDLTKSAISFGELQILWYRLVEDTTRISSNNKCEPHSIIATQNDWRKRKELYDYCVDYDTLQQIITNYDTLKDMNPYYDKYCKQIYKYLKEKDKLYKEYKENCFTSEPKNCPDFFTKCANKDPTILLNKLSCSEEMQRNEALSSKKEGPATTETDPGLTAVASSLPTDSQISHEGTNPVTNTGNVLLGVVVTSMTSGALYKVKTDFIITY